MLTIARVRADSAEGQKTPFVLSVSLLGTFLTLLRLAGFLGKAASDDLFRSGNFCIFPTLPNELEVSREMEEAFFNPVSAAPIRGLV